MTDWIDEDIATLLRASSARLPAGWAHTTMEIESGIVLDINRKEFEKLTWPTRVKIAEETKLLEAQIQAKGIPCAIQVL